MSNTEVQQYQQQQQQSEYKSPYRFNELHPECIQKPQIPQLSPNDMGITEVNTAPQGALTNKIQQHYYYKFFYSTLSILSQQWLYKAQVSFKYAKTILKFVRKYHKKHENFFTQIHIIQMLQEYKDYNVGHPANILFHLLTQHKTFIKLQKKRFIQGIKSKQSKNTNELNDIYDSCKRNTLNILRTYHCELIKTDFIQNQNCL